MSYNICALSGMICDVPVVSKKSGHIFEKRLIYKQIEMTGKCPVTKHELTKEDLLEINIENNNKPRSLKATSLPGMFSELQIEWEKILLESSKLKKDFENTKQELAHSLYQHDASVRVIAKLIKERDAAQQELADLTKYQEELGNFNEEADLLGDEFDNMGISQGLIDRITELSYKLIHERKNKKNQTNPIDLNYSLKTTITPFADKKSDLMILNPIGITCSDICENFISLGANDGTVSILELNTNNLQNSIFTLNDNMFLKTHKRKINDIKFYPSKDILGFATCSDDSTTNFMIKSNLTGKFENRYNTKTIHSDSITSISFHPLEEYAIMASLDGYWSFHNLLKGVVLHKELNGSPINTIEFHPDGGLFGSGQLDGSIKLWDITSQQEILKLHDHGMESVHSISFSQNGFYLASSGEDDLTVRIWDIRKNKVVKNLNLEMDQYVNKVSFDTSGNYLTLAGHIVGICDVKTMTAVFDEKFGGKLGSHKNICTSVNFGNKNHDYLISTSLNGEVNFNTI